MANDEAAATRSWQFVMEEILKLKRGEILRHRRIAANERAFDDIRRFQLFETRAEHFLRALE